MFERSELENKSIYFRKQHDSYFRTGFASEISSLNINSNHHNNTSSNYFDDNNNNLSKNSKPTSVSCNYDNIFDNNSNHHNHDSSNISNNDSNHK